MGNVLKCVSAAQTGECSNSSRVNRADRPVAPLPGFSVIPGYGTSAAAILVSSWCGAIFLCTTTPGGGGCIGLGKRGGGSVLLGPPLPGLRYHWPAGSRNQESRFSVYAKQSLHWVENVSPEPNQECGKFALHVLFWTQTFRSVICPFMTSQRGVKPHTCLFLEGVHLVSVSFSTHDLF